jgi:hypothetical protein
LALLRSRNAWQTLTKACALRAYKGHDIVKAVGQDSHARILQSGKDGVRGRFRSQCGDDGRMHQEINRRPALNMGKSAAAYPNRLLFIDQRYAASLHAERNRGGLTVIKGFRCAADNELFEHAPAPFAKRANNNALAPDPLGQNISIPPSSLPTAFELLNNNIRHNQLVWNCGEDWRSNSRRDQIYHDARIGY